MWLQRGCHWPHWLPYELRLKHTAPSLELGHVGTGWLSLLQVTWEADVLGSSGRGSSVYSFFGKVEILINISLFNWIGLNWIIFLLFRKNTAFSVTAQTSLNGHLNGDMKNCFPEQIQNHELSPSVCQENEDILLKKKVQREICIWNPLFYHTFLFIKFTFLTIISSSISVSLRTLASIFQGFLHKHRKTTPWVFFKSKLKISWDLQSLRSPEMKCSSLRFRITEM